MSQLGDAVQVHPDLGEAVNMYFSQVNQASRCERIINPCPAEYLCTVLVYSIPILF